MENEDIYIMRDFRSLETDPSWAFSNLTVTDTSYITHGYYTYPAKFIPQLAKRLIMENSNEGDIVVDPFMGSGTTIVEALVNRRVGVGTDINEIAALVAKVKTTPIDYEVLTIEFLHMEYDLRKNRDKQSGAAVMQKLPERVDFWFLPEQKEVLSVILARILEISYSNARDFFLVAFAQILKSCSIWAGRCIKPIRDMEKKPHDPLTAFFRQARKMIKHHFQFDLLLCDDIRRNIDTYRTVQCGDSRHLPCGDGEASLAVTSPPYVTSYEYADLHQLPALWLGFMTELSDFRKKFIGSAYTNRDSVDVQSSIADVITAKFTSKKQREVRNYFADMLETFQEMRRILKIGGRACVVIGDTEFQGIPIYTAAIFQEQMKAIGFKTETIIRRAISSKMLPSTRDPETGKFSASTGTSTKLAYPTEYILIMERI